MAFTVSPTFVGSTIPFIDDFLVLKGDPSATIGGPIPEGRTQVTILEFWATWCPPCIKSIPHLSELQRKYKDVDFTVIGAAWEQGKATEEKIREFVQNHESMDYTVVLDKNESLRKGVLEPSEIPGIPFAVNIVNNVVVSCGHPLNSTYAIQLEEAAAMASKK